MDTKEPGGRAETARMPKGQIVFIDTEVCAQTGKVLDYGAAAFDGRKIHTKSADAFFSFVHGFDYVCGHNILEHDLRYLPRELSAAPIDTLYLSPLLFPRRPYHALVKDDKLQAGELNNPLNDALKAMELFCDIWNAYVLLPDALRELFYLLLHEKKEFAGYFAYMGDFWEGSACARAGAYFAGWICAHVDLERLAAEHAVALAYCLALVEAGDRYSVVPHWVHIRFPYVEEVMAQLRSRPCKDGCAYCDRKLDARGYLKSVFGYEAFRTYDGKALQEEAVEAALRQESLLAVFPTGGGKSLAFQVPALLAGEAAGELTVVLSPLQSLMKDQVDNLERKGVADAVMVNGLLSPLERAEALERAENGQASILYISPEMLRSRTIERILLARSVARFVIDEAHCFSAWGQDFRVDYLYIGEFIRALQEKKGRNIPVSCFTATAKQNVVSDIQEYFQKKLGVRLRVFEASAERKNLRYRVVCQEGDEGKYAQLRSILEEKECPCIVYVSRTKRCRQLAAKLCDDGFLAKPFYGKMDAAEKHASQEAFLRDEIQVMVATSAFGMGVDKPNVQLVVHYDISDSLENYVQEAGRAGRDASVTADCIVLFAEGDLDKHFMLLNQTKLSISEIQQVWKGIKDLTGKRRVLRRSPLELARQAGWDELADDMETRVKAAVQALENAGYLRREKNVPHVYANSILVPNMIEASARIDRCGCMDERVKAYAKRILQMLISKRSIAKAGMEEAESRIDYISDMLGIPRADVVDVVSALKQEGILADTKDLTAYMKRAGKNSRERNKTGNVIKKYISLEAFLLSYLVRECMGGKAGASGGVCVNLKEANERAQEAEIDGSSVRAFKTILYFWSVKNDIHRRPELSQGNVHDCMGFSFETPPEKLREKGRRRGDIALFIADYLYEHNLSNGAADPHKPDGEEEVPVLFSVLELKEGYEAAAGMAVTGKEVEDALLYISKIDAMRLEDGFFVLYNSLELWRLERNNRILYKVEDYRQLQEFYRQKAQQIHIVGEYARQMASDGKKARQFVNDYFQMDYRKFLRAYFNRERLAQMERNITPAKYQELIGSLSQAQRDVVEDGRAQYIVVAAGPGSGKTKLLVHKLASLLMLEDVKHEQLLMITFSRASATEFKKRLIGLIGSSAARVEIKTFHSYCFDLLGRVGRLEGAQHIVAQAAEWIRNGDVQAGKITKTVVVIDEAQDMDAEADALVRAMMEKNEGMRVIAVGDDDQNIYAFRGSNAKYFRAFAQHGQAATYQLLENYRSRRAIVRFANAFAARMGQRMKSQPAIAVQAEEGIVRIIRYASRHLETAVASRLLQREEDRGRSVGVLTSTNEEALKVFGLLLEQGRRAKLIQSNTDFSLYNLVEIRFFLQTLKKQAASPIAPEAAWQDVKAEFQKRYADSACLPVCLRLLETFEQLNEKKYLSDLEEFVRESKLEDFYQADHKAVAVSTIHKAKGKEFDVVHLLLNQVQPACAEDWRKLYVGITRAKQELYIHTNSPCLDGITAQGVEWEEDAGAYGAAKKVISQLGYKDVVLDFFKEKREQMLMLRSGAKLRADRYGLYCNGQKVVRYSRQYQEKIKKFYAAGYEMAGAKIRFILAWKGKGDARESVILLPDIDYHKV